MTEQLVVAPVVVALVSVLATLSIRSWPRAQRAVSVAGGVGYAGIVAALAWTVVLAPAAPGAAAYQLGGWPAPFGITLVADGLSTFMLVVAAAVGLASVAFSAVYVSPGNQRVYYHPLFHCLLVGVSGALLTGDLFNLFVWFEVMLMASYVLVAFYGGSQHTAAALRYLVVNVVGSALMLLGIGGLYAVTGTLNMADMARRVAAPAAYGIDVAPVLGLSALLFATFALKAGLVPFQFWVPAAYSAAPLPVTAMLAGATKKVGIYAIIRLYFTVLAGAEVTLSLPVLSGTSPLTVLAPTLFAVGIASIVLGGLGAVGRERLDEVLAYSSIGQVGFIVVPVAVAAAANSRAVRKLGLVAAVVFALHHALAKGLLFLTVGAVRSATGTNRLADLGGLGRRAPVLASAFLVGSLSLVGIPPLSGFFGKFLVFRAAVDRLVAAPTAARIVVLSALVAGSLLTIVYTTRAWTGCFWGGRTRAVEGASIDTAQVAVLATVAAVVVLVGVGFEPVVRFARLAAEAALDTGAYVEVVDPMGGAGT